MDNIHVFDNISDKELEKMMICFKSQIKTFPAHEQLLSSSASANQIGVLLSGEADVPKRQDQVQPLRVAACPTSGPPWRSDRTRWPPGSSSPAPQGRKWRRPRRDASILNLELRLVQCLYRMV